MNGLPQDKILELLSLPTSDLQQQVQLKVEETAKRLTALHPTKALLLPKLAYDLKGTTGGWAVRRTNTIRLNYEILTNPDHSTKFIDEVVPHELCHIACYQWWPNKKVSHGYEWQLLMLQLGLQPSRCHTFPVTKQRVHPRNHVYTCNCSRPKFLTNHRHGKIQRGTRYTCNNCGAVITYSHTEDS